MRRTLNRLTKRSVGSEIEKVKKRGKSKRIADGGSLYLSIQPKGNASWVFFATRMEVPPDGRKIQKRSEMGLGSYPAVTLAAARLEAGKLRAIVADGSDPLKARKAERRTREVVTVSFT